jgi:hypothetical protein
MEAYIRGTRLIGERRLIGGRGERIGLRGRGVCRRVGGGGGCAYIVCLGSRFGFVGCGLDFLALFLS